MINAVDNFLPSWASWRASIVMMIAMASCKFSSKKDIRSEESVPGIFVQNSFALERGATGKELVLRFSTTVEANCEIKHWQQSAGDTPPNDAGLFTCPAGNTTKDFSLTITDLKSNPYFLEVSAWPVSSDASSKSRVIVKESELSGKASGGIVVARLNIPLATIDIVRARDELSPNLLEQKDKIGKCEKNTDAYGFFSLKGTLDSSIFANLKALGFLSANGNGLASNDSSSNVRLRGDSIRSDEPLVLELSYLGRAERVSLTVPSIIISATLTAVDTLSFPKPQLAVAEREVLDVNASSDLRLNWSLSNVAQDSVAVVSLGFTGQESSIKCVFDASSGAATIPADFLKQLPSGKHDVALSILSKSKLERDQNRSVPWTIVTNDWRLARIQML